MKPSLLIRIMLFILVLPILVLHLVAAPNQEGSSPAFSSVEQPYSDEFQDDLRNLGIDPALASNCQSCSYDPSTGVLALAPGASIDLKSATLKEGTIIELNGGNLQLPSGTLSGLGSYTAGEPPSLAGGILQFDPEQKAMTIRFQDSVLIPEEGAEIHGNGHIVNGKIFLDQGDIAYEGITEQVQAVQIEKFSDGKIHLLGGSAFRIGNNKDSVRLEGLGEKELREITLSPGKRGETVLAVGKLIENPAILWQREEDPDFLVRVQGHPTIDLRSAHPEARPPQPARFLYEGQEHRFLGTLSFRDGTLSFPQNLDKKQPQMIDGVYVRPRTAVSVYFNDNIHAGENYLALGEQLRMGGDNFIVALGEKGEGCPHLLFCYEFEENKYVVKKKEEGSPYRLLFNFDAARRQKTTAEPVSEVVGGYGEVLINPAEKMIRVSGTVRTVNGVHELEYFLDGETQKYNYRPAGCGASAGVRERSCTAIDYDFTDGGIVNVVKRTNLISLRQGEDQVTLPRFGDQRREGKVTLNREQVYVLGYKGGELPETLLGKGKEQYGFGHVGLLYCTPTSGGCEWTVTEADGRTVRTGPLEDSLFGPRYVDSHADGLWKVVDDDGKPILADKVMRYADTIIGAPYGKLSLTGSTFSCVEVVCEAVKAAGVKIEKPPSVSFGNLPFKDLGVSATVYTVLAESFAAPLIPHVPDTVVQSPNLQPVQVEQPTLNEGLVQRELIQGEVVQ